MNHDRNNIYLIYILEMRVETLIVNFERSEGTTRRRENILNHLEIQMLTKREHFVWLHKIYLLYRSRSRVYLH